MTRARQPRRESIPPSYAPAQAIPLIRRQIERLAAIQSLRHDDPMVSAWESTTESILDGAFGMPDGNSHEKTARVIYAEGHGVWADMSEAQWQRHHFAKQDQRRALLEAYIEDLETLAPPTATTGPEGYGWHSEIERVSGAVYRDGHYREAIMNACIRVIEAVKAFSGLSLDGDPLMNRAFSCAQQTPVIQFNALTTQADRDEQMGFLYLYKGLVGIRNSKMHSIVSLNDPIRAFEYLAFTSLLLHLIEIATKNTLPPPPSSP